MVDDRAVTDASGRRLVARASRNREQTGFPRSLDRPVEQHLILEARGLGRGDRAGVDEIRQVPDLDVWAHIALVAVRWHRRPSVRAGHQ